MANPKGRSGAKRAILDLLAEGPEIPANIAIDTGIRQTVVRTHLYQLKVAGEARSTGRTVPHEAARGRQRQTLWERVAR
jgi:predicted ArsR family transcriptional regulator